MQLAEQLRPHGLSGRVWLVHGFNVKDRGRGTTGQLRVQFEAEGFEVLEFSTGWRGLAMVRFGNAKRARKLASLIRPGDVLLGHSDGCNIIDQASWQMAGAKQPIPCAVIYCNPALDRDAPLARQVRGGLVFHTRSDWVVKLSSKLAWHPWGDMGRVGYRPKYEAHRNERYINCSYEHICIPKPGHSGAFKQPEFRERIFVRIQLFLMSLQREPKL